MLFDVTPRRVILNGIEDIVSRPDLADRALFLTLEGDPRRAPSLGGGTVGGIGRSSARVFSACSSIRSRRAWGYCRKPNLRSCHGWRTSHWG